MIEVRISRLSDAYEINPKGIFADNPNIRRNVQEALRRNIAYTFVLNSKPIAILGYAPINERVGEVWGFISDDVGMCPIVFHRKVAKLMNAFVRKYGLNRLQMVVRDGYSTGLKWAAALGFKQEGLMRSYGYDGSDYILMGRVF